MSRDRTLLEGWLAPYLEPTSVGGARRIAGLPAAEARAALALDPAADPGYFDGLPGAAMLADAALAAHPDSHLCGLLIDADRPDSRLHLDTVVVPATLSVQEVLASIASVIPEDLDADPHHIEQVDGAWSVSWD